MNSAASSSGLLLHELRLFFPFARNPGGLRRLLFLLDHSEDLVEIDDVLVLGWVDFARLVLLVLLDKRADLLCRRGVEFDDNLGNDLGAEVSLDVEERHPLRHASQVVVHRVVEPQQVLEFQTARVLKQQEERRRAGGGGGARQGRIA